MTLVVGGGTPVIYVFRMTTLISLVLTVLSACGESQSSLKRHGDRDHHDNFRDDRRGCSRLPRTVPTWSEVQPIIQFTCVGCHNSQGQARFLPLDSFQRVRRHAEDMFDEIVDGEMPRGNPRFRRTREGQMLLDFLRCGDFRQVPQDPSQPDQPPLPPDNSGPGREPRYAEVKPVIDRACASCHNPLGPASFFPFTSIEEIRPMAADMLAAIEAGRMPQGNPSFKDSSDGVLLRRWLVQGVSNESN
jgi:hypothetical protein